MSFLYKRLASVHHFLVLDAAAACLALHSYCRIKGSYALQYIPSFTYQVYIEITICPAHYRCRMK